MGESAPQLVLQIYILLKDPHASRLYPHRSSEYDHPQDVVEPGVNPVLKLSILVMSGVPQISQIHISSQEQHQSDGNTVPVPLALLFHHSPGAGSVTVRLSSAQVDRTTVRCSLDYYGKLD